MLEVGYGRVGGMGGGGGGSNHPTPASDHQTGHPQHGQYGDKQGRGGGKTITGLVLGVGYGRVGWAGLGRGGGGGLTILPQPRTIKQAILNMDSMVMNKEGVEVRQ